MSTSNKLTIFFVACCSFVAIHSQPSAPTMDNPFDVAAARFNNVIPAPNSINLQPTPPSRPELPFQPLNSTSNALPLANLTSPPAVPNSNPNMPPSPSNLTNGLPTTSSQFYSNFVNCPSLRYSSSLSPVSSDSLIARFIPANKMDVVSYVDLNVDATPDASMQPQYTYRMTKVLDEVNKRIYFEKEIKKSTMNNIGAFFYYFNYQNSGVGCNSDIYNYGEIQSDVQPLKCSQVSYTTDVSRASVNGNDQYFSFQFSLTNASQILSPGTPSTPFIPSNGIPPLNQTTPGGPNLVNNSMNIQNPPALPLGPNVTAPPTNANMFDVSAASSAIRPLGGQSSPIGVYLIYVISRNGVVLSQNKVQLNQGNSANSAPTALQPPSSASQAPTAISVLPSPINSTGPPAPPMNNTAPNTPINPSTPQNPSNPTNPIPQNPTMGLMKFSSTIGPVQSGDKILSAFEYAASSTPQTSGMECKTDWLATFTVPSV